jgi:hypothetical protein
LGRVILAQEKVTEGGEEREADGEAEGEEEGEEGEEEARQRGMVQRALEQRRECIFSRFLTRRH